MKNYYFITILLMVFVLNGCILDEYTGLADKNTTGASTIDIPPSEPYILGATESIDLVIDATKYSNASDIASVSVTKSFDGANATVSDIDAGSVTSFPTTISLSLTELLSGVNIAENEVAPGDTWTFTYTVNLKDGRVLKPARTTSVSFSCLSDLANGGTSKVYTAVSGGTSTDGCPPVNPVVDLNYEVTLSEVSAGVYSMSDFSAGVYQEWYGACYGYTFETSGTLTDVCGSITLDVTDAFGCPASGQGSVNPNTGVITLSWSNCFGDTGNWTLTPK